ncbi:hypothetical protein DFH07DRAFT_77106 [Mycena maculata]|uniref:Uncharacterized protein n=1 Tax=Mycena maculata TaxID=230809 RepID=A0AAD7N028_9AGAR|nr:hypothetical protein DFH07DRAFT_77106 [Mycena maculata]
MTKKLMGTIMPYSHQWRWLELDVPASSCQIFGGLLPGSVPRLEYLSINLHQPFLGSSNPWTAFQDAPKLNDLCIGAAHIQVDPQEPTFPWSQLTRIDVGDCSPGDCLQILAQASTATFCIFDVTRETPLLTKFPTSFVHPQLQTLKIDALVDVQSFWTTLTCSVLSTLSLELRSVAEAGTQDLPRFLARCNGTIQNLTLNRSGLNEAQFLACLRDMPRLRQLDMYEDYEPGTFADRVCEALTLGPVFTTERCPRLIPELATFSLCGGRFCSDNSLTRMLESRMPRQDDPEQRPLKHLFLYICRKMSSATIDRLCSRKTGCSCRHNS